MIALIKNGIPHPQTSHPEIILRNSPLISDSGQDHSSEDSLDSCEEIKNRFENSAVNKRTKLKTRSISDSTDEELGCSPQYKGILKYKGNNRLRSLSESCAGSYSLSIHGESNSALDDWCEEGENDDDGDDGEHLKSKKTVRFSNVVHKQLFRSNSSILGQRKKNQRKARNKAKKHAGTKSSSTPPLSSSVENVNPEPITAADEPIESKLSGALENVNLCDSGIEIDDSDPGTNQSQNSNANGTKKKNKKKNRVKPNRRRAVSESSSGDMIFDLDL